MSNDCECWENHAIGDVTESSCGCQCHRPTQVDQTIPKEAKVAMVTALLENALEFYSAEQHWNDSLTDLMDYTHGEMKHWWLNEDTNNPLIVPTKLMLVVTELAEAMEGHRKNLPDDKLPHRSMLEVELADALIRILDLAGALDLDLGGAYVEKMAYNRVRADHKPEARMALNGKQY